MPNPVRTPKIVLYVKGGEVKVLATDLPDAEEISVLVVEEQEAQGGNQALLSRLTGKPPLPPEIYAYHPWVLSMTGLLDHHGDIWQAAYDAFEKDGTPL